MISLGQASSLKVLKDYEKILGKIKSGKCNFEFNGM